MQMLNRRVLSWAESTIACYFIEHNVRHVDIAFDRDLIHVPDETASARLDSAHRIPRIGAARSNESGHGQHHAQTARACLLIHRSGEAGSSEPEKELLHTVPEEDHAIRPIGRHETGQIPHRITGRWPKFRCRGDHSQ